MYIEGSNKWLKLIDKCYSVLLPSEIRPSIHMVFNPLK